MNIKMNLFFLIINVLCIQKSHSKLNIVATTTDLKAIVSEVGGNEVTVDSIAKGTQDPHFIEAKPSYMLKASHADLLISTGLDLEIGWLPSILQGARNPKIKNGASGRLEVGPLIEALEIPKGSITRSDGDVHPFGNPHVTLDPIRSGEIAIHIAKKMSELDSSHSDYFFKNAKNFQNRMIDKTKKWNERIQKSGVKKVVSYHKTLTYFFNRFNLENSAILEPKPGIPPTSAHIIEVITLMKTHKIPIILVENYFDPSVTKKIKDSIPSLKVDIIPVSIDGEEKIKTMDDLYERIVSAIESVK